MIITPDYCRQMARYNTWQNSGYRRCVEAMSDEELDQERGAFFGSIRKTLNHLLWGDMIWMHRFAGTPDPSLSIQDSTELTIDIQEWSTERFRTDGRIEMWADGLKALDLQAELTWYSGAAGREFTRPIQPLIVHFFNHQTHHRGQVHAMITSTGRALPDTDFFLMPEPT